MKKSKFARRMNALFYAVLGLSLFFGTLIFVTPQHIAGTIDDVCPSGTVKTGYSFQNGQGSLECMKSSYYTLQHNSPKMLAGVIVGLVLASIVIVARRPHVFRSDNLRLGIRTKQ